MSDQQQKLPLYYLIFNGAKAPARLELSPGVAPQVAPSPAGEPMAPPLERIVELTAQVAQLEADKAMMARGMANMRAQLETLYQEMVGLAAAQATADYGHRDLVLDKWADMWRKLELSSNDGAVH